MLVAHGWPLVPSFVEIEHLLLRFIEIEHLLPRFIEIEHLLPRSIAIEPQLLLTNRNSVEIEQLLPPRARRGLHMHMRAGVAWIVSGMGLGSLLAQGYPYPYPIPLTLTYSKADAAADAASSSKLQGKY
tara:strand:+ start:103 stop:489 length:387 start_codon:yes stop_codon:yes gene_type:complete